MGGLFNFMSGMQPRKMRGGLLDAVSNQGAIVPPMQQAAPMDNGAAQALQAFQQAQAMQRQAPAAAAKKSGGGGIGKALSLFKLFMGG